MARKAIFTDMCSTHTTKVHIGRVVETTIWTFHSSIIRQGTALRHVHAMRLLVVNFLWIYIFIPLPPNIDNSYQRLP
jgi:transcriptional regulator of met regulon